MSVTVSSQVRMWGGCECGGSVHTCLYPGVRAQVCVCEGICTVVHVCVCVGSAVECKRASTSGFICTWVCVCVHACVYVGSADGRVDVCVYAGVSAQM